MNCCGSPSGDPNKIGQVFSFFAKRYRKKFKKGELESSQKLLKPFLEGHFENKKILEVGCGVGVFHQTLIKEGATSAVGVDIAEAMIDQAVERAAENGLSSKTTYLKGDLVELADKIEPAEITILDKVVCCYPEPEKLLAVVTSKSKQALGLTYPRNYWLPKLAMGAMAVIMKILRTGFRPYVYDPKDIQRYIENGGMKKTKETWNFFWLSQLFERKS